TSPSCRSGRPCGSGRGPCLGGSSTPSCGWRTSALRGSFVAPQEPEISVGEVHEVEIQARLRDINTGGHVDNVEAVRVLNEARIRFFGLGRRAEQLGIARDPGLLDALPDGVTN